MPYNTATKNARMTATQGQIDAGSGPGALKIFTAGYAALVATVTLNDPCGTVAGGVLTMSGFAKTVTCSGDGPAAIARVEDSAGVVVRDGITVGVGAGFQVNVNAVTLNVGEDLTINSFLITHG